MGGKRFIHCATCVNCLSTNRTSPQGGQFVHHRTRHKNICISRDLLLNFEEAKVLLGHMTKRKVGIAKTVSIMYFPCVSFPPLIRVFKEKSSHHHMLFDRIKAKKILLQGSGVPGNFCSNILNFVRYGMESFKIFMSFDPPVYLPVASRSQGELDSPYSANTSGFADFVIYSGKTSRA